MRDPSPMEPSVTPNLPLAFPALPTLPPIRITARTVGRVLAVAVALGFVSVLMWILGPANILDALLDAARREASVFMSVLAGVIGLSLFTSATALFRGRPVWSIGFAVAPLLALAVLLVR